jgi:hypothetical protein
MRLFHDNSEGLIAIPRWRAEIAKPIVMTATTSRQNAVNRPMRVVWRSLMGRLAMIHCTLRAGAAHRNSWHGPLRQSP